MAEKKGGGKELNLGLTEILSKAAEQGVSPGEPVRETSIVTVEDDLGTLNPELSKLAESGQWGVLVSRAERSIATEEDIEARLWWIRGHLGAFTLPVSLLAAPFEAVCRNLVGDSRAELFADLLREIGNIMLGRLADVGDRRQEYSVRLALCQLGWIEANSASRASYGKVPPKVPRFEMGVPAAREVVPEVAAEPKKGRRVEIAAAVLVIGLSVGLLAAWQRYHREPVVLTARESFVDSVAVPGMVPPSVVARPVSSSLGALFYSIERSDSPDAQGGSQAGGAAVSSKAGASARDERRSSSLEDARVPRPSGDSRPPAPVDDRRKERVRTDGPVEGADFSRGVERNSAPQPKLPDVVVEPDQKPAPDVSYPDGSLNVGGEIKSAIVRTDVFDSPSYHARVIARLVPGDKVSVEGRVGQWFRIRSRRGRAGFVFAQDIGEIEDFTAGASK